MIQKGHKHVSRSITILSKLWLTLEKFKSVYIQLTTYGGNRKSSLFLISTILFNIQILFPQTQNCILHLRMSFKAKKLQ